MMNKYPLTTQPKFIIKEGVIIKNPKPKTKHGRPKGFKVPQESIDKMKSYWTPEARAMQARKRKGIGHTPEQRKRISEGVRRALLKRKT